MLVASTCRSPRSLALSLLLVCAGCGEPASARQASPEEMARLYPEMFVQVSKAEPPPYCIPVGAVIAGGYGPEDAYGGLRKRAADAGGNYVVMDGLAPGGIFGRAFRCPVGPAPVPVMANAPASPPPHAGPAAAPPAAASCEPECSPGYLCLKGACVSACNPPCASGQRCEADRLCHAAK